MINKNNSILLFSITLFALLFWLSVSLLSVAHSEKQDSEFLKNYVAADKILRNASVAIAQELTASYWLTGFEDLYNPGRSLTWSYAKTDEAIEKVYRQYRSESSPSGYRDNLRFRRNHIEDLYGEFKDSVSRLGDKRNAMVNDLDLPLAGRDENFQTSVLDTYSNLIEQIELLRFATTYTSLKQSRRTRDLFAISDAAWNIRLANHLLTPLFEGYLTSGAMASGQAIVRANARLNKLKDNIKKIRRIDSYANVDSELKSIAGDLDSSYKEFYYIPAHEISFAMAEQSTVDYSNFKWKNISSDISARSENLLNYIEKITIVELESAAQRANRNLLIAIILVLLCASLVCFAWWIVKRVHYQATCDVLTGLPNRRSFVDNCKRVVDRGAGKNIALIKVDLSNFKFINDIFGQITGDKLLQEVATRLSTSVSSSNTASRLAGDEFALLVENTTNKQNAAQIAKKLAATLSGQYCIDGQSMQIKTTIGMACFPEDASSSEDLIKSADLALQKSKQKGPGTVTPFNSAIADAFLERQQIETELGFALDRGEFELHYQPQFDVFKQAVEGVEALIRWRHPERGLVSPLHFIPVAEEAGLLPAIGEWVIGEAIRQSVIWRTEENLRLRMSVNVSVHQFVNSDVVGIIQKGLKKAELDPDSFEIEITESVAMYDVGSVIAKLNKLHNTGVRIALDDFGTGYSSLSYLRDLPLDTLKIDRSFVTEIDEGCRTQKLLLESIASMAKQLNLHTVAEGVETDSQLRHVCALGIDTVQGYYYAKPVPAADLPRDVRAIDAMYAQDLAA